MEFEILFENMFPRKQVFCFLKQKYKKKHI